MYAVKIYNKGVETIIHEPNPDKEAPHISESNYNGKLSRPDIFTFRIPLMNPGWGKIEGLNTKVKVFDVQNNSVLFSGRVMPFKDGMNNTGIFNGQAICQGALGYLKDSQTRRWNYENKTPTEILTAWLDWHNATMENDDSRKIYLGTVEIEQPITIDTNYETVLNSIITKLVNILGGDIRVRETSGILYLDYVKALGVNNEVKIELGQNQKSITREYDPTDVVTRSVALGYGEGINQLTIASINNGIDYVEDAVAKAKYGIIEGLYVNKEIQNPYTLKIATETALKQSSQPKLTIDTRMIDRSVLAQYSFEKYNLGDTVRPVNQILGIDVYARVIETQFDILTPHLKDNVISTRPITLTDEVLSLKQRMNTTENAPQGSTFIDTYGGPDNIDATHPMQIPIWVSPDILNVNRVRLHIDGQKYRAYEKGVVGEASVDLTSGPSSESSSKASTKNSAYVDEWKAKTASGYAPPTKYLFGSSSFDSAEYTLSGMAKLVKGSDAYVAVNVRSSEMTVGGSYMSPQFLPYKSYNSSLPDGQWEGQFQIPRLYVDIQPFQHFHDIDHTHNIEHFHEMDHTHENGLDYGIYEDTYPKSVYVKLDGVTVAGPFGTAVDSEGKTLPFSVDLDLTQYIGEPGKTYNLEISSAQNGRVNAWVSVQAFIQAK